MNKECAKHKAQKEKKMSLCPEQGFARTLTKGLVETTWSFSCLSSCKDQEGYGEGLSLPPVCTLVPQTGWQSLLRLNCQVRLELEVESSSCFWKILRVLSPDPLSSLTWINCAVSPRGTLLGWKIRKDLGKATAIPTWGQRLVGVMEAELREHH